MDDFVERASFAQRTGSVLDRIEAVYLKVLRTAVLLVATVLLLWALAWASMSVVRVLRSPDSVVEKPATVLATELTNGKRAKPAEDRSALSQKNELTAQRRYYDDFVKRYARLYSTKYKPARRSEDKDLTVGEFDDLTIDTSSRLDAIRSGDLDFATDKKDLETFLPIVTEATASTSTGERLSKYRTAKKKSVITEVQRSRTESRRGWDSLSSACENWYETPIGCAVTRKVEIPYTERVAVMRYPEGIESPINVLKSYQDRYFSLLHDRREQASNEASANRQEILDGQDKGWIGLSKSVMIAGAFLALMFFFLLVAIERHQRRQAAL